MKRISILIIALSLVAGAVTVAHAQSGAEANAWAEWCRQQGGTVEITGSNPICHPGDSGGGPGFTANQQAMLDVAGQLGSALGAAIRQSFVDAQRQAAANEMRRRWEAEQARQRAQQVEAEQRARNQQLLASMHSAVGPVDLRPSTSSASGQLRMRTADEMFRADAGQTPLVGQGGSGAYVAALQNRDAAQAALDAKSADLIAAQRLVAEAERNARDNPGASAAQTLARARALRDQAQRERSAAEAALDRANASLQAADDALAGPADVNTNASVVDLRDASATPTLVTALPQGLPRLQEVEDSPGREKWTLGMQAVINHDWARAADLFAQARALDPSNQALINAHSLAEFTRDHAPDAQLRAQLRRPTDADLELLFPQTAPAGSGSATQVPTEADLQFVFVQDRVARSLSDLFDEAILEQIDRDAANTNLAASARREIADDLAARALVRLQNNRDVEGAIALLDQAARQAPEVPNYAAARDALAEASRYRTQRTPAQPGRLSDQSRPSDPHN